jgi:hypothetical protein
MTATALVSVSWGVLALGSVYPWAYWPLQWGALITGLLGLRRVRAFRTHLGHPMLLAVLVLCGAVLLQLIPLSPVVIGAVSPATSSFVQNYVQLPIEIEAATDGTFSTESDDGMAAPLASSASTVTALVFTLTLGLMVTGGALGLRTVDARALRWDCSPWVRSWRSLRSCSERHRPAVSTGSGSRITGIPPGDPSSTATTSPAGW